MSFDAALKFSLRYEGGYSDIPQDAGGPTNHGVTQHVYDSYRDIVKLPHQSVQLITDSEVRSIYEILYWEPAHCDAMQELLAIAHFDGCVNLGISGGIRMLQRAAGLTDDGIWGKDTAAEVLHEGNDLIKPLLDERRAKYRAIVAAKPSQEIFLKGWLARCDALEDFLMADYGVIQ